MLFLLKACGEKEKMKGTFCLTQGTLENTQEKTNKETSFSVEEEIPNKSNGMNPTLSERIYESNVLPTSSELPLHSNRIEKSEVSSCEVKPLASQSNQQIHNLTVKVDLSKDDEKLNTKSEQTFDINDYSVSVNKKELQMLSLLDFAGNSAYYACHHLFYSPRAFFYSCH